MSLFNITHTHIHLWGDLHTNTHTHIYAQVYEKCCTSCTNTRVVEHWNTHVPFISCFHFVMHACISICVLTLKIYGSWVCRYFFCSCCCLRVIYIMKFLVIFSWLNILNGHVQKKIYGVLKCISCASCLHLWYIQIYVSDRFLNEWKKRK